MIIPPYVNFWRSPTYRFNNNLDRRQKPAVPTLVSNSILHNTFSSILSLSLSRATPRVEVPGFELQIYMQPCMNPGPFTQARHMSYLYRKSIDGRRSDTTNELKSLLQIQKVEVVAVRGPVMPQLTNMLHALRRNVHLLAYLRTTAPKFTRRSRSEDADGDDDDIVQMAGSST